MMEMVSSIDMRTASADRNTGVELLSITDAAVKALEKPRFNRTVDVRCVDHTRPQRPQVHAYSNSTGTDAVVMEMKHDTGNGYSDSANASARSVSCDSDRSSTLTDSAFLSGTAKPVKVSAKRLTEIKSPFDEPLVMHPHSSGQQRVEPVHLHKNTGGALKDRINTELTAPEYQSEKPIYHPEEGQPVTRVVENRLGDGTVVGSAKGMPSESMPTLDSGYITQQITVIQEVQGKVLSDTDEGQHSDNTMSSIEAFLGGPQAHKEVRHVGDEVDELTAPEIILPDVSPFMKGVSPSRDCIDIHVGIVTQCKKQPPANKFARYQPGCALRQGTLMEGSEACQLPPQTRHDTDVHISTFSLTSRDKALRQTLAKRMHKDVAIKKVVQPTLVQTYLPTEDGKHEARSGEDSVSSAAAVAAVSAVIATQPFLKAQQDMEKTMSQLLEKLTTSLPRQPTSLCQSTEHATQQEKIGKLEEKLSRLTNNRLSHLEKLQAIQFQAQLAVRNKKAGALPTNPGKVASKRLPHISRSADEIYKSTSPTRDVYTTDRGHRHAMDASVLNTPAPRARPPMPTSFVESQSDKTVLAPSRNTRKVGGLLEEILADQGLTPECSPFPETPSSYQALRGRPVGQLSCQPTVVSQPNPKPRSHTTPVTGGRHSNIAQGSLEEKKNAADEITGWIQVEPPGGGSAPLDLYLTKPLQAIPLSPYPSLKDVDVRPTLACTPYVEARIVLEGVHNKRNNLEANLDTILRSHYVLPSYDVTTPGVTYSDNQRTIEKMVDERIKAMNADVQRDVLDELRKIKDLDMLDMIPERDTSAKRVGGQLKPKGKVKVNSKVTAAPRSRVGSKAASRIAEKENVAQKKTQKELPSRQDVGAPSTEGNVLQQTAKRQPSTTASEAYLTHVYGKPAYQNQRSTVRSPYLRFQTVSKTKPAVQLPKSPVLVEGYEVATHRTQTDPCWTAPAADRFYFDPTPRTTQEPAYGSPVMGQLVAVAVPLAAPRKDGSRQPTVRQLSDVMTSTPVSASHGVAVRFQDEMEQTKKMYPTLTEKMLPAVDIDSTASVASEMTDSPSQQLIPGTTERNDDIEEEEDETFVHGDGALPLSVHGSRPRYPPYHGPQFPPPGTGLGRERPKQMAGVREMDLLQTQAVDWIEQELMARVISQMDYDRGVTPHDDNRHDITRDNSYVSEVTETSQSPRDSFIAETMGEAGLQLFLDAGCAVDNDVVNSLIKEVLLEKITSMTGEATARERPQTRDGASDDRLTASYDEAVSQVPSSEVSLIPTPLPTPKPTPIASRTHSPVRSLTRSLTTIPAVHEGEITVAGGSKSPTPSSRRLVTGSRSPAASPRLTGTRANQPGVALKEPTVTQPTAAVTVESTTAVSRQLEQAAAMVLANTSNMLTHAAAALVNSQAPATVHNSDQRAADLEKAVALVLSSAKQGQGAGTREEWDVGRTDTEEELEVDVRGSEEDVMRELRLMETLGTTDGRKDESEEYILSRHDIHTPSLTPQTTPPQVTPVASTGAVSEQAPVPELPPRERRITPGGSPQPWGDPNAQTRDVHRSYEMDGQDRRDRNTWEGKKPVSPPNATSHSMDTASGTSEGTTNSMTDFISEGQWLITPQSEGEVLHLPQNEDLRERAIEKIRDGRRQQARHKPARGPSMTDDTLGDTEDFIQEDITDISRSEGECLHQGAALSAPQRQFVSRVANLRESLIQEQAVVNQSGLATSAGVNQSGVATSVSLGEIVPRMNSHRSLGQVTERPHKLHKEGQSRSEPRKSSSHPQFSSASHPAVQRVDSSPRQRNPTRHRPTAGQVMPTDHHKGARPRFKPSSSGELSDEWRTLTPDQINVDALLQTNDYFGTTQSDLGSNLTDPPVAHSAGELQHQHVDVAIKTGRREQVGEVASSMRLSVTIPSMTEEYSSGTDSLSKITASPT